MFWHWIPRWKREVIGNSLEGITKGKLSLINLLMCGKGPGLQIATLSAPPPS